MSFHECNKLFESNPPPSKRHVPREKHPGMAQNVGPRSRTCRNALINNLKKNNLELKAPQDFLQNPGLYDDSIKIGEQSQNRSNLWSSKMNCQKSKNPNDGDCFSLNNADFPPL